MSEPYRRPTVASCTFVGQTAVCRTKVLALRGGCGAPESRCFCLVIRKEPRLKMGLNHADLGGEPPKSPISFCRKIYLPIRAVPEQSALKTFIGRRIDYLSIGRSCIHASSVGFARFRPGQANNLSAAPERFSGRKSNAAIFCLKP